MTCPVRCTDRPSTDDTPCWSASVAGLDDDGSLLAINLYRHNHQGLFSEAEITQFAAMAPTLFAIVQRHPRVVPGRGARCAG